MCGYVFECKYHATKAVTVCSNCGVYLCGKCANYFKEKRLCPDCFAKENEKQASQITSSSQTYESKMRYKVMIRDPMRGILEDYWELSDRQVKQFVDEEGTAYAMCAYFNGEPKYSFVNKVLWENWDKTEKIMLNPNLSAEKRNQALLALSQTGDRDKNAKRKKRLEKDSEQVIGDQELEKQVFALISEYWLSINPLVPSEVLDGMNKLAKKVGYARVVDCIKTFKYEPDEVLTDSAKLLDNMKIDELLRRKNLWMS